MQDADYAEAFRIAETRAMRSLEDEAVRRAHDGIRKPVWYKGRIVGYETEYPDALLLALLKAGNPEKFRDRSRAKSASRDSRSICCARFGAKPKTDDFSGRQNRA